jgi:hypothetical protein
VLGSDDVAGRCDLAATAQGVAVNRSDERLIALETAGDTAEWWMFYFLLSPLAALAAVALRSFAP